ncbi:hypothetical protein ACFFMN_22850 [Planobispora siamensis]|uniref:Uncharacterized protein n=1 Tax=Planobispora siamensis TaxID=936338 RepID=A0A8J3SMQ3_9ACTN|nr:hypothetical protein [Planobispora siamensis]GIH95406.1 hypothetical protein Psi01_60360 [Planobispora siamensis]
MPINTDGLPPTAVLAIHQQVARTLRDPLDAARVQETADQLRRTARQARQEVPAS